MPIVKRLISFIAVLSLAVSLNCSAQEKVDLDAISKIRYEGFHNSKIMEIASGLMDQIGGRLTGSPNMRKANDWTRDKLKEFGLVNSHLEPWEPFGRGSRAQEEQPPAIAGRRITVAASSTSVSRPFNVLTSSPST